ncbi:MAG: LPS assembly protein LptD [Rhodospirillales bacterium]
MAQWLSSVALVALLSGPAAAQGFDVPVEEDRPALITADEVTYNEQLGIVTASGSVEISQGARVLVADSVSYNTRNDVVTANGNVALLEPGGEVLFADYAEVTGDLREAFVRDVGLLLTDTSRLAAVSAIRTEGNRTELTKAVYSPCELCESDPTSAPLWQLKARKVVHDQEAQTVTYRDAHFEVFGLPVFYTPYFSHPDPTVERKTGFLAPTYGGSGDLGLTLETPFFIVIDDTSDATIAPIFTTKELPVLQGEYRKRLENGFFQFNGSGTVSDRENDDGSLDRNAFRGHVKTRLNYDLDDTYRAGFLVDVATDDTYLRTYDLGTPSTLFSEAFVEGFRGRDYATARLFGYQGLSTDDNTNEIPIALPYLQVSQVSDPLIFGSVFNFDASAVDLVRIEGRDTRRLNMLGEWVVPFSSPLGDQYRFIASLQADGYWVSDYDPDNPGDVTPDNGGSELAGRLHPQAALMWSFPFVGDLGTWQTVIEPIAQGVLATRDNDPNRIPNEDSLDLEFDDTNLFAMNRFPGVDRVQPGPRVDYGAEWSLLTPTGGSLRFLVGQSYRPFDDKGVYPTGSGLENKVSNVVGGLRASPGPWLDATWRFSMDSRSGSFDRNEIGFSAGVPQLRLNVEYLESDALLDDQDDEILEARQQITFGASSQVTENWFGFASHLQDLQGDGSLRTRAGIRYSDECIIVEAVFERSRFDDRELDPDNSFFVKVSLRSLGDIGLGG